MKKEEEEVVLKDRRAKCPNRTNQKASGAAGCSYVKCLSTVERFGRRGAGHVRHHYATSLDHLKSQVRRMSKDLRVAHISLTR